MSGRKLVSLAVAVLIILGLLVPASRVEAFSSNQAPVIRIGEWKSHSYGVLIPWGGLAFDPAGNLWVADSENNRVLGFMAPFSGNMSASFVIGQPNFQRTTAGTSAGRLKFPMNVAFDHAGNLWVVDTNNNRVLEFEVPFYGGMNASVVIGQSNFSTAFSNATRSGLNCPEQVAFDSAGNLWVADSCNARVLEFQPPFNTDMNASLVIGEPDFSHKYCQSSTLGYDASCSNHSTLTGPSGIAFDPKGDIWVMESYMATNATMNGRLVEFKPPFKSSMQTTLVMQPVFASAMTFDSAGDLWLACPYCYGGGGGNVVEYRPPFSEGSIVWENGNATNAAVTLGESWEYYVPLSSVLVLPVGLTFDSAGNLWVVDARSSWLIGLMGRVVGYDAQVHLLDTHEGRVYFENQGGLLAPLSAIPFTQMDSIQFPEGLFNFTIQGLPPGGSGNLTIAFTHVLTPGTEWLSKSNGRWSILPPGQTSITGTNMTLTLNNASQTGVISVFGGPAHQPPNITSTVGTSTTITTPLGSQNISPTLVLGGTTVVVVIITSIVFRKRLRT